MSEKELKKAVEGVRGLVEYSNEVEERKSIQNVFEELEGVLWEGLRSGVEGEGKEEEWEELRELVGDKRLRGKLREVFASGKVEYERMERNVKLLVETASAARGKEQGFGGGVSGTEVVRREVARQRAEQAREELGKAGYDGETAYWWTLWWQLGEEGLRGEGRAEVVIGRVGRGKQVIEPGRIVIWRLEGGRGCVEHPRQALRAMSVEFEKTVKRGWEWGGKGGVMWWVKEWGEEEKVLEVLKGESHGGGVYVGMRAVSEGKEVEKGKVVLGKLPKGKPEKSGEVPELGTVGDRGLKVAQAGRYGIGEVVVCGRELGSEERDQIPERYAGEAAKVRVKWVGGDGEAAYQQMTGAATAVGRYLEWVEGKLGELPGYFPKGFGFETIRQKVSVSRKRLEGSEYERRKVEQERLRGNFSEREEKEVAYANRGWEMYEGSEKEAEAKEVVEWDEVCGQKESKRMVVLGDPGHGKSWLLRYEGRKVAREGKKRLAQGKRVSEIEIPLVARLGDVANELQALRRATKAGDRPPTVGDAIVAAVWKQPDGGMLMTPTLKWELEKSIESGKAVVLLDALDEVPQDTPLSQYHVRDLKESLTAFARSSDCRMVLTSRIVGYGGIELGEGSQEVELLAFEAEQAEQFVEVWFSTPTKNRAKEEMTRRGDEIKRQMRSSPQIRGLARVPVLTSLICLIGMEEDQIPERRSEVYELALRKLLKRKWKEAEGQTLPSDAYVTAMLKLLGKVAWHFGEPKWQDVLGADELAAFLDEVEIGQVLGQIPDLLKELSQEAGILVKVGKSNDSRAPYLFLHKTFHEYLVARHLADQPDWLERVKKHFWYNQTWGVVIPLLAGCLKDPNPLIEAILDDQPDFCHEMLRLAGRCLPETNPKAIPVEKERQVLEALFEVWKGDSYNPKLARMVLAQNRRKDCVVEWFRDAVSHADSGYRKAAAEALRDLNRGDIPGVVDSLVGALGDENGSVRESAAEALVQLGRGDVPGVVEGLVGALGDKNEFVRGSAAKALGQIGRGDVPGVVDGLVGALGDGEWYVRGSAAEVLGQIGRGDVPGVVEGLVGVLGDEDEDLDVIESAAWALVQLGRRGAPGVVEGLVRVLGGGEWYVRGSATEALGEIGRGDVPGVVEALVGALGDEHLPVRWGAVLALGKIGRGDVPGVVEALVGALGDEDPDVRLGATEALVQLGRRDAPRVIDGLVRALGDKKSDVCRRAAEALVQLGRRDAPRVIDGLVRALGDKKSDVCRRAAEALVQLGRRDAPRVIDGLVRALGDKKWRVRWKAAEVLGQIGRGDVPGVVEGLVRALGDKNSDVRLRSAEALVQVASENTSTRVVDSIFLFINNPDRFRTGSIGFIEFQQVLGQIAPLYLKDHTLDEWLAWRTQFAKIERQLME